MKEVCVEPFYKENLLLKKKIIPKLFASRDTCFLGWRRNSWVESAYLACSKPWVRCPALGNYPNCQNTQFLIDTGQIIDGVQLAALGCIQGLRRCIPSDLPETWGRSRTSPASSPHRQGWLHTALRACRNLCFAYSWQVLGGCTGDCGQILDKCSAWAAKYQIDQLEKRRRKHGYFPGAWWVTVKKHLPAPCGSEL